MEPGPLNKVNWAAVSWRSRTKQKRHPRLERKLLESEQHHAPVFANVKNLTSVLSQQKYQQSLKQAVKHRSALHAQQRTDKLIQTRTNRYSLNFLGIKEKICVMRKKNTHIWHQKFQSLSKSLLKSSDFRALSCSFSSFLTHFSIRLSNKPN